MSIFSAMLSGTLPPGPLPGCPMPSWPGFTATGWFGIIPDPSGRGPCLLHHPYCLPVSALQSLFVSGRVLEHPGPLHPHWGTPSSADAHPQLVEGRGYHRQFRDVYSGFDRVDQSLADHAWPSGTDPCRHRRKVRHGRPGLVYLYLHSGSLAVFADGPAGDPSDQLGDSPCPHGRFRIFRNHCLGGDLFYPAQGNRPSHLQPPLGRYSILAGSHRHGWFFFGPDRGRSDPGAWLAERADGLQDPPRDPYLHDPPGLRRPVDCRRGVPGAD